jgi:hypothetical protein
MPTIPPELPKESRSGGDLCLSFTQEDVNELPTGDGNEARSPDRLTGLRADERVKDEFGAVWQDSRAPALGELAQTTKALERTSVCSADGVPGWRNLGRVPLGHHGTFARSKIHENTRLRVIELLKDENPHAPRSLDVIARHVAPELHNQFSRDLGPSSLLRDVTQRLWQRRWRKPGLV